MPDWPDQREVVGSEALKGMEKISIKIRSTFYCCSFKDIYCLFINQNDLSIFCGPQESVALGNRHNSYMGNTSLKN